MADYNGQYTGQQIDEAVGKVSELSLKVGEICRDLGRYEVNEEFAQIGVGTSGKAYNVNGELVNKEGYAVSNAIGITKGNVYLFKSSVNVSDVALFTYRKTVSIQYDTKTETVGDVTRPKSKFTQKGDGLIAHTYTYIYNTGNSTAVADDIEDNGESVGADYVIPTTYTEYVPMFSANGVIARPKEGYYCLVASVSGDMIISGKESDMTGYLIEVRYGVLASIINNLARKADIDEMSNQFAQNEQIVSYALNDLNTQKTSMMQLNNAMAELEIIVSSALCDHNRKRFPADQIVPLYNSATSYEVGDYCLHDNKFYRCIEATEGNPFTPSQWTNINLMSEIKRLINN